MRAYLQIILLLAIACTVQADRRRLLLSVRPAVESATDIPDFDGITGVSNAWSTAGRIFSSYSGNLIHVTNANTLETNIGVNAEGWLDTNSLTSWADGNNVWVTTIYDQVRTNHLVQNITGSRPLICASGVVQRDDAGYPSAVFDGSDDFLATIDLPSPPSDWPASLVSIGAANPGSAGVFMFVGDTATDNISFYLDIGSGVGRAIHRAGGGVNAAVGTTTITNSTRVVITGGYRNDNLRELWTDAVSEGSNTASGVYNAAYDLISVGQARDSSPSGPFGGTLSDWLYVGRALETNDLNTIILRK